MKYVVYHVEEEDREEIGITRTKDENYDEYGFDTFRDAKNYAVERLNTSIESYREQIKKNQEEIKRVRKLNKKDAHRKLWENMDQICATIVEKFDDEDEDR